MEPKRLTDADLRAIRARVEAVVRGNDERWEWREDELLALWDDDHCQPVLNDSPEYGPRLPADAEFIAHARADIPALLGHADALAAENARLREALGDIIEGASKYDYGEKGGYPYCALCDETYGAHAPDCPIAAARRALEGGE